MLIRAILGMSDGSGSAGSITVSRNRYGQYIRQRTKPVNPSSVRQQNSRANFDLAVSSWGSALTQAQRDAWNVYAANVVMSNRLGQDIFLSGFNHFTRSYAALLAVAGALVAEGPAIQSLPPADPQFAITASAGTQLVSVTFDDTLAWLDEDGGHMSVQVGLPKDEQIEFFNGPWRFADSIDGDGVTPPTSPATLTSPYPIQEGQRLFARARIIRLDGRVSEFFRATGVVAS